MKPPFMRTSVPSGAVSPENHDVLMKRAEFMTLEKAMEEPVPAGYSLETITDFDGTIVYPAPAT